MSCKSLSNSCCEFIHLLTSSYQKVNNQGKTNTQSFHKNRIHPKSHLLRVKGIWNFAVLENSPLNKQESKLHCQSEHNAHTLKQTNRCIFKARFQPVSLPEHLTMFRQKINLSQWTVALLPHCLLAGFLQSSHSIFVSNHNLRYCTQTNATDSTQLIQNQISSHVWHPKEFEKKKSKHIFLVRK